MKAVQLCCVQLLFAASLHAQINNAFLKHLSENNLQREHWTYLTNMSGALGEDSSAYLKTKYYLQYFDDSLFLNSFKQSGELFISDTAAFTIAGFQFLNNEKSAFRTAWFDAYPGDHPGFVTGMLHYCYMAGVDPTKIDETKLPKNLQRDFRAYKKSFGKKPVVGMALSMAVPGLGKLYAGRPRSFYSTFLAHLVYGVQNYEVIRQLGVKNPVSIFSMGFLGVFYVSNIVAGYNDVKKVKNEKRAEFLKNAATYFQHTYPGTLYP